MTDYWPSPMGMGFFFGNIGDDQDDHQNAYKSNLNSSSDAGGQVAQFVGKGDNISH